jgi:hypothetical protein
MPKAEAIDKFGDDAVGVIYPTNSQYIVSGDNVSDIVLYEVLEHKGEEYCFIKRFVGRKLVDVIRLPTDDIPAVKIVAEYAQGVSDIYYTSIVDRVKDTQKALNLEFSNSIEMVKTAPIQPLMVAEGQVGEYKPLYQQLNKRRMAYLPYKPTSLNGAQVPPPFRLDNTAQTQGLTQMMASEIENFSFLTSISGAMMGEIVLHRPKWGLLTLSII